MDAASTTLSLQHTLPKLPVPELEQSVTKHLESVRALFSQPEYEEAKRTAEDFLRSDLSRKLQAKLKSRAADAKDSSWLLQWWNKYSYLAYRDPVRP